MSRRSQRIKKVPEDSRRFQRRFKKVQEDFKNVQEGFKNKVC